MLYDIIFVTGEIYFDHPLSGTAMLKRWLEKHNFKVGIIEKPAKREEVTKLGKPKLFFGVTSGAIDSMVRNYTPLKKLRINDKNLKYNEEVPDRAVSVYSNWIKQNFKDAKIVLGGTEASLRRFTHYDYWENRLRKPLLFDTKTDIIAYGSAEKQILEIANKIKKGESLEGIEGTCIISKTAPETFKILPSYDDVVKDKSKFVEMQNGLTNYRNLAQKIDNRYLLQYKSPIYTSKDLDEYYGLPFTRKVNSPHLNGFEFSMVTHRGCYGDCSFCSLKLMQGSKVVSRSEESILSEIKHITKMKHFKGNIDDLGGPSVNMYGTDCNKCEKSCIDCKQLNRTNEKLIQLLQKARKIPGVKKVYVRSGIRYDMATPEYVKELLTYHTSGTIKIAPEHITPKVLKLMNKDKGDLDNFIKIAGDKNLTYYFMLCHPGASIKEDKELADKVKTLKNNQHIQLFTPTPMTDSTCMYYTGLDINMKKIHVTYTYKDKKIQKNLTMKKTNLIK